MPDLGGRSAVPCVVVLPDPAPTRCRHTGAWFLPVLPADYRRRAQADGGPYFRCVTSIQPQLWIERASQAVGAAGASREANGGLPLARSAALARRDHRRRERINGADAAVTALERGRDMSSDDEHALAVRVVFLRELRRDNSLNVQFPLISYFPVMVLVFGPEFTELNASDAFKAPFPSNDQTLTDAKWPSFRESPSNLTP